MPSIGQVLAEAVVVGVAFVFLFGVVHSVDMWRRPGPMNAPPQEHPSPAMNHAGLGMQAFVAGFVGHIVFEVTGVNKKYCDNYG